jgi:hypothetical protein
VVKRATCRQFFFDDDGSHDGDDGRTPTIW